MAIDTRSITITLKAEQSGSNSEVDTSKQTSSASAQGKNDNDSQAKAIAAFAVAQLGQAAVSEIISWADYYWNRELILNDDYIGQRNKQIAITHISRGANAISSIGSSAASGAMVGGWVGAVIGAVIGTTVQAAQIVRSNVQGRDQQTIMLKQMETQLNFTRARAGWSTSAASIGEDL